MAFPKPPEKIVPFNSGVVAPHDIGRQFDEHSRATARVIDFIKTVVRDDGVVRDEAMPASTAPTATTASAASGRGGSTAPVGALGPNAGGKFAADDAGATATSADYAQVSIDWAEHMPDTIPPNTLAINAVTGDHWSSRWWANRAAQLVNLIGQVGSIYPNGVFAESVAVTGVNTLASLTKDPAGPVLLVVNNQAFLPVGSPPPFTVIGRLITWGSTIYGLQTTDVVSAWYPYGTPTAPAPPQPSANAVALYYVASQGQTTFPLAAADYYSNFFGGPVGTLRVTRNGARLMPDFGTGVGGFNFVASSNTVTLIMPAGAGEIVIIDVWGVS